MKIAILALVVVAILAPGVINLIAYKLKGPWENPEAVGKAIRWAAIGGAAILVAIDIMNRVGR
jgi:hypothetical protein